MAANIKSFKYAILDPEFISQIKREIPRIIELLQDDDYNLDRVQISRLYETIIEE